MQKKRIADLAYKNLRLIFLEVRKLERVFHMRGKKLLLLKTSYYVPGFHAIPYNTCGFFYLCFLVFLCVSAVSLTSLFSSLD